MNENNQIDRQAAADHSDGTENKRTRWRQVLACPFCEQHCDDPMMPYHDASDRCESGKHPHCTCDTCF